MFFFIKLGTRSMISLVSGQGEEEVEGVKQSTSKAHGPLFPHILNRSTQGCMIFRIKPAGGGPTISTFSIFRARKQGKQQKKIKKKYFFKKKSQKILIFFQSGPNLMSFSFNRGVGPKIGTRGPKFTLFGARNSKVALFFLFLVQGPKLDFLEDHTPLDPQTLYVRILR